MDCEGYHARHVQRTESKVLGLRLVHAKLYILMTGANVGGNSMQKQ